MSTTPNGGAGVFARLAQLVAAPGRSGGTRSGSAAWARRSAARAQRFRAFPWSRGSGSNSAAYQRDDGVRAPRNAGCQNAASGARGHAVVTEWGVIPSIRVRDMAEALAFYLGPLGFTLDSGGDGESNSSLTRGDAHVMIETAADHYGDGYNAAIRERLGTPSSMALYMEASDLDALYSRLEAAGVRIVDPLAERPWGQAEFTVEDHEGNWLTFWKKVGGD